MAVWTVTVHERGRRSSSSFGSQDEAFEALAAEVVSRGPVRRDAATAFAREIAPEDQVVVRVELRGPRRVAGGVDLRGDGTAQAYTGRWVRRAVAADGRETAVQALRRVLGA